MGVVGYKGSELDSFGEVGVGLSVGVGCIQEKSVYSQDAFEIREALVLGEMGEIAGKEVHGGGWG